jgi:hypothetical protein
MLGCVVGIRLIIAWGDYVMVQHRYGMALLALCILWQAGCASNSIQTSTTFDPLTAFPAQATYVWDDRASQFPDDPRLQSLNLESTIKQLANEEFAKRGYRLAGASSPDYRLSTQLAIHTWIGADNSLSLGSLSLLLVEADTNRRVWLGFGRAEVYVGLSEQERRARLREGFAAMLEKFPPAQRGE